MALKYEKVKNMENGLYMYMVQKPTFSENSN